MISCQIISGHFVGWHPQFCSTVDAQVWNWFFNHILLVYHSWHHTNRAIEIIDCFLSYWWPSFDSGVGPADHLQEFGIPVHRWEERRKYITEAGTKIATSISRNLPVGENLQDHYGTGALTFTVDQVLVISSNFAHCCIVLIIMINVFQPVSLVQTRYENIPRL